MITRDEIAQLTAKGRTQLFDELCAALFRTQEEAAVALEVTRRTIQNWRSREEVPLMALLALHPMMEVRIGQEMVTAAEAMERAANLLRWASTEFAQTHHVRSGTPTDKPRPPAQSR